MWSDPLSRGAEYRYVIIIFFFYFPAHAFAPAEKNMRTCLTVLHMIVSDKKLATHSTQLSISNQNLIEWVRVLGSVFIHPY